jgi:hypothetical protein
MQNEGFNHSKNSPTKAIVGKRAQILSLDELTERARVEKPARIDAKSRFHPFIVTSREERN